MYENKWHIGKVIESDKIGELEILFIRHTKSLMNHCEFYKRSTKEILNGDLRNTILKKSVPPQMEGEAIVAA